MLVEYKTINDQIFIRVSIFNTGSENVQGIEPPSALVDSFSDKIGGINFLELLFSSSEGIMNLRVWHSPTFEPTVKNFLNSSKFAFSLLRRDSQMVDALSMEVGNLICSCKLFKLLNWANADDFFTIVWDPKRNGIPPESVPGEAPVPGVFEPVSKSTFLDGFGHPISFHIIFDEVFFDISDLDKPTRNSFINKRSITSPTERIIMLKWLNSDHSSFLL